MEAEGQFLPAGTPVTVDNGHCLYLEKDQHRVLVDNAPDCAQTRSDKWFIDVSGRIHLASQPELCFSAASPVTLDPCSTTRPEQRWIANEDDTVVRASNPRSALDYHRNQGTVVLYGLTNTANQVWNRFEASKNPLVGMLDAGALSDLWAALSPQNLENLDSAPEEDSEQETEPQEGTEPEASSEPEISPEPETSPQESNAPQESEDDPRQDSEENPSQSTEPTAEPTQAPD